MLFSHIKKKNINTKNQIPPKLWYCDSGWPTVIGEIICLIKTMLFFVDFLFEMLSVYPSKMLSLM